MSRTTNAATRASGTAPSSSPAADDDAPQPPPPAPDFDATGWRLGSAPPGDLRWVITRAAPLVLTPGGARIFGARVTDGGTDEDGGRPPRLDFAVAPAAAAGQDDDLGGAGAIALALAMAEAVLLRRIVGRACGRWIDAWPDTLALGVGTCFTSVLRVGGGGAGGGGGGDDEADAVEEMAADAAHDAPTLVLWLDPAACRDHAASPQSDPGPVLRAPSAAAAAATAAAAAWSVPQHGSVAILEPTASPSPSRRRALARAGGAGPLVELRFYASDRVRRHCARVGMGEVHRSLASSVGEQQEEAEAAAEAAEAEAEAATSNKRNRSHDPL